MKKRIVFLLMLVFSGLSVVAQQKKFAVHTVAFYNIENFYDTINDPNTYDDEWVYSKKYFTQKVDNIARVLAELGTGENPNSPTVIGLAEVENKKMLETLVKNPRIASKDYGIVHFDSPDRRGIDCAFLYQKKHFQPLSYKNIPLYIYEKDTKKDKKDKKEEEEEKEENVNLDKTTKRIYTRDQILMSGMLDGEEVHFIVNHWPSRRGGEKISSNLREMAAALNVRIIDSLQKINPNAKVMTMGDLNDGPFNNSIKKVLNAKGKKEEVKPLGMYNPMEKMANKGNGTLAYRDAWDIFDQIIITEPLLQTDYSSWRYWKAGIYNKPFMIQTTGQYKGYGLRNSATEPGFSDHFPVYIYLIKEAK
ncbi:endonuclease/exonuclease/phosphatase family protein [Flavobacterium enshiense]|uniref:endonuclease/exonuclease/phosphatase family protein n=1 Tax=Flavobacterium enshiense TaxID=1341165 RepID=UPI00345CD147